MGLMHRMTFRAFLKKYFAVRPWVLISGLLGLTLFLSACESGQFLLGKQGGNQGPVLSSPPSGAARPTAPATPRPPAPKPPAQQPKLPTLEEILKGLGTPKTPGQAQGPAGVSAPQGVRTALLLPLSGPNARVGQAMLNAAQMALFDFAQDGFEMTVHDTRGTPDGARAAAQAALAEGVRLIMGPLLSGSVRAIQDVARPAGVPVLAFSNDRSAAAPGVYTLGFSPGDEVTRVVDYAISKGASRFALLAPDSEYGRVISRALRQATLDRGVSLVDAALYDPAARDYSAVVRRVADYNRRHQALLDQRRALEARNDEASRLALKRLKGLVTLGDPPFDAVVLADGGKRLTAIAALLPFYDIDPQKVHILGAGQWDAPGIGAEPALLGGWYAAPAPQLRADFIQRYKQVYAVNPPRVATLAYDACALAVVLGAREGGPAYGPADLTTPTGFVGRDGIFRLMPDGSVQRGLAVLEVGRHSSRVIDPAPKAFP